MAEEKSDVQEMPPPYSTPTVVDGKSAEAAYPPQAGYPPQGYPLQDYPPQGYPPQGYPPQGYPQQGYPPQGYPAQAYQPQIQSQATSNNVVVIGQPVATPTTTKAQVQQGPRANDFLIFSVVLMVLCCFHGNILSVLLTVPALICSLVAQDNNRSGNYSSAKQCGYMALGCNIAVIAWYVVEWIIAIIVIAVVYSSAAAVASSYTGCRYTCGYYGYYSRYTCTYRCY